MEAEYVAARRTLLDALEGLGDHREAVVVVGAQAIYLQIGEHDGLAVAPFTTDADLSLDPERLRLRPDPRLELALADAGFSRVPDPAKVGTWVGPNGVEIDLMVAEALAGTGRWAARIPPHADGVARKARGLEASLVDRQRVALGALEDGDPRAFQVWAAGQGALLVAKLHKIADRLSSPTRLEDKDALDVLRLLRGTELSDLVARLRRLLASPVSRTVTEEAIDRLRELFGAPDAQGTQMAVRATTPLEDPDVIAASCATLAADVLDALAATGRDR